MVMSYVGRSKGCCFCASVLAVIYLGVSEKDLVDIMRRVLDKLVVGVEDNKANLAVAEDTQLHRFLHQSESSLLKGDL